MISRVAKVENRGMLFGAYSSFGTMGTLLINKLGGYLYDEKSHIWPFGITLIVYAVLMVATLAMGFSKKINI